LPLCVERTGFGRVRRARLLGSGPVGSDDLGSLQARGDRGVAVRLADRLAQLCASSEFDLVELSHLDPDEPFAAALDRHLRTALHPILRMTAPCPTASRPRGGFPAYLESLQGGAGSQFRRRARWLERQGGFAFERLTDTREILAAFSEFLVLHAARFPEGTND